MFVLTFVKKKCHPSKWSLWKSWKSLIVATSTFGSSRCAWCFPNMGFGGLLMGVQQFPMMKITSRIPTKRRPRHLHYFVNISQMHNLHTFNIAKMSKVFGRHFVMCLKPRLSETSCFFERGSSPSKHKKGKTKSSWFENLARSMEQCKTRCISFEIFWL